VGDQAVGTAAARRASAQAVGTAVALRASAPAPGTRAVAVPATFVAGAIGVPPEDARAASIPAPDEAVAIPVAEAVAGMAGRKAAGAVTGDGRVPLGAMMRPPAGSAVRVAPAAPAIKAALGPAAAATIKAVRAVAGGTRAGPAAATIKAVRAVAGGTRAVPAVPAFRAAQAAAGTRAGPAVDSGDGARASRRSQPAAMGPSAADPEPAELTETTDPVEALSDPSGHGQDHRGARTALCGVGSPEAPADTEPPPMSSEAVPIGEGAAPVPTEGDRVGDIRESANLLAVVRGATTTTLMWVRVGRDGRRQRMSAGT
jgi:hypothetical protein